MTDTRPAMTQAEFDAAAAYAYPGHWLTGEEHFLHVEAVMRVEGWNAYGHPGQPQLTEPQRVLMMWSDLVGQTANGGFIQFVDNFSQSLALAYRLISQLGWPDLLTMFDRAFREQVGDPLSPVPRQEPWSEADDAAHAAGRAMMVDALVAAKTKWKPWVRKQERIFYEQLSDIMLNAFYHRGVEAGEITDTRPAIIHEEDTPSPAADAFDTWFYLDETREASKVHVGAYIRRNRDALARNTD